MGFDGRGWGVVVEDRGAVEEGVWGLRLVGWEGGERCSGGGCMKDFHAVAQSHSLEEVKYSRTKVPSRAVYRVRVADSGRY